MHTLQAYQSFSPKVCPLKHSCQPLFKSLPQDLAFHLPQDLAFHIIKCEISVYCQLLMKTLYEEPLTLH